MRRLKKWASLALVAILLSGFGMMEALAELTVKEMQEAFVIAAFTSEYGPSVGKLRRWAKPIKIAVEGPATAEDLRTLDHFIALLNLRVNGLPKVSLAKGKEKANLTITYAPLDELPRIEKGYVPGNWGLFLYWWDGGYRINKARVLLATDVTTQEARNHLLLEEIVGLLGLANDIDSHPDSIIYQPWTTVQHLSELDWELLDLLYDSRLKPGMSLKQANKALGWE